jgi:hypothetical protein
LPDAGRVVVTRCGFLAATVDEVALPLPRVVVMFPEKGEAG